MLWLGAIVHLATTIWQQFVTPRFSAHCEWDKLAGRLLYRSAEEFAWKKLNEDAIFQKTGKAAHELIIRCANKRNMISSVNSQQHRVQHVYVCHLDVQSKALRERWLLDGAPAEEETQKRLHEDEVKTKLLEQVIFRLAPENPIAVDI